MERIATNRFRLSTGREIYANHGLISLSLNETPNPIYHDPRWEIAEGYDGSLYDVFPNGQAEHDGDTWTPAERLELADFMIALWTQFRDECGR